MKRINRLTTFAGIALAAATITHQPEVKAQPSAVPTPAELSSSTWHEIQVRHVSPRIMAWWITHQVEPEEISASRKVLERIHANLTVIPQQKSIIAEVPKGVQAVVADDTRSLLRVLATKAGAQNLAKLVDALDKPFPQVEITAQFVQISLENVELLGVDFRSASEITGGDPKSGSSQASIGRVHGNLQGELARLMEQNKAWIVMSPRITITDNLAARVFGLGQVENTYTGTTDAEGNFTPLPATAYSVGKDASGNFAMIVDTAYTNVVNFHVSSTLELVAKPVVNSDGTVALFVQPSISTGLYAQDAKAASKPLQTKPAVSTNSGFPSLAPSTVSAVATLRDGETIALQSLSWRSLRDFGPKFKKAPPQRQNIIVLVTARIVRTTAQSPAAK